MSNSDQITSNAPEDALERLLKQASPRPMPPPSDVAAVRQAVRAEWREVSGARQSRRRVLSFAMAATVLVAVFSLFNVFRMPPVEVVQVASIARSFGSVYLLGESAELRETRALSNVLSGQTIVTGSDSGIAFAWGGGGSLRMDGNTRVRFVDSESVYLDSGRIYFDSMPSLLVAGVTAGDNAAFVVRTEHGDVAHIGTQFMIGVDDAAGGTLTVSVREGQVAVDGSYHSRLASAGEQLTLAGRQRPDVLSISRNGDSWDWVTRTSPVADVDGRALHEFLLWACREMGLELQYEGQAERVAREEAILKGSIDTTPAEALRLRLASAALSWRIEEGVIYVSDQ